MTQWEWFVSPHPSSCQCLANCQVSCWPLAKYNSLSVVAPPNLCLSSIARRLLSAPVQQQPSGWTNRNGYLPVEIPSVYFWQHNSPWCENRMIRQDSEHQVWKINSSMWMIQNAVQRGWFVYLVWLCFVLSALKSHGLIVVAYALITD